MPAFAGRKSLTSGLGSHFPPTMGFYEGNKKMQRLCPASAPQEEQDGRVAGEWAKRLDARQSNTERTEELALARYTAQASDNCLQRFVIYFTIN